MISTTAVPGPTIPPTVPSRLPCPCLRGPTAPACQHNASWSHRSCESMHRHHHRGVSFHLKPRITHFAVASRSMLPQFQSAPGFYAQWRRTVPPNAEAVPRACATVTVLRCPLPLLRSCPMLHRHLRDRMYSRNAGMALRPPPAAAATEPHLSAQPCKRHTSHRDIRASSRSASVPSHLPFVASQSLVRMQHRRGPVHVGTDAVSNVLHATHSSPLSLCWWRVHAVACPPAIGDPSRACGCVVLHCWIAGLGSMSRCIPLALRHRESRSCRCLALSAPQLLPGLARSRCMYISLPRLSSAPLPSKHSRIPAIFTHSHYRSLPPSRDMARLALTSLVLVLTLALSALAGPVPRNIVSTDSTTPAVNAAVPVDVNSPPKPVFSFGPGSVPLPAPTRPPGTGAPLEMDWLS
ncbi:hypothetical protein BC628DRAFT_800475 [Trametes gibbosa]|nr:hypothetical protein BC628DRAFT_800475 [Trametes gibbosa]